MKVTFLMPSPFLHGTGGLHPRHIPYYTLITATNLAARQDVEPRILDAFALGLSAEQVYERPEIREGEILCIPYTHDHREVETALVLSLCAELKRRHPAKTIVLYNRYALPADIAQLMGSADYLLEGDFERLFPEFIACLTSGRKFEDLDGVSFRRDGALHRAKSFYYAADPDLSHFPDLSLLPMDRYVIAPHRREEKAMYYIESAKGCSWGRCNYCQENMARIKDRKSFRPRSPENIIAEVEYAITTYGIREFQFNNAQFQIDLKWLTRFEELLTSRNLKIKWTALSRADFLTPEMVAILKRTGCYNILIGIESLNETVLQHIHKNSKRENIERGVRELKRAGIGVTGSFLIGLPGESPWDAFRDMNFSLRMNIDYAQVFIAKWNDLSLLEPFRGHGRILEEWDYSKFDFSGPIFLPNGYRNLFMLKLVQQLSYLYFYLHPLTIGRFLLKIRRLEDLVRMLNGGRTLITLCLRAIPLNRQAEGN